MKVLMISTDKNIFKEGSGVRERMIEYGGLVEELHIIVFAKKNFQFSVSNFQNIFIYPTNSKSRWFYVCDAIKLGKKINADIVTAQDPFESGLAGWFIKRKLDIPLQLQIHTDFLSPYFAQDSILNRLRVFLAKFLIPRADCIRVVSERIRKSLKKECFVLPIFVDVEKIKNAPVKTNLHEKYPQFDFIILMASRLTKEKNITLAIKAVKEINDKKIGLIIVGGEPEKKESSANIIFEPWTNDLISYYKTADLFLLTSNYEGYGMTLMEAAAAGCKIISSDVGIAGEILEKENIFKVGDRKDLQEKIEKAIRGEIKPCLAIKTISKQEYLENYKKSWDLCGS